MGVKKIKVDHFLIGINCGESEIIIYSKHSSFVGNIACFSRTELNTLFLKSSRSNTASLGRVGRNKKQLELHFVAGLFDAGFNCRI